MRTTRSKRREEEAASGAHQQSPAAESNHNEASLASISNEAVGRLLKRAASRKAPGQRGRQEASHSAGEPKSAEAGSKRTIGKRKVDDELHGDISPKRCTAGDTGKSTSGKVGDEEGRSRFEANDFEWEDGSVSVSESREAHSHDFGQELTVEFTDTPSSAHRKPPRRASAKEKELAELVHKVHLLCLLARGRLVDDACNDPLLQGSLLSLVPSYLLKIGEVPRLTSKMLGSLVRWFHENFRIRDESIPKESFKLTLAFVLETREGTTEEIAALSVALFRALNLTTRFVSILDVASLKPDVDKYRSSNKDAPQLNTRIASSATTGVSPNQIYSQFPACSAPGTTNEDMPHETSQRGKRHKIDSSSRCKKTLHKVLAVSGQSDDASINVAVNNACCDKLESCATKCAEGSKRKGDVEFELQLEMALSATAADIQDCKVALHDSSPFLAPPSEKDTNKIEEPSVSMNRSSSAVWSRKTGPPLYWAEVFCSGETLTGRWVHVDAANALIDGEEKVETTVSAWRKRLRYVVAFAGSGAKDVTRRYCTQWYKIASQRISSDWWDTVLAPLKEMESVASGSMLHFGEFQENTLSNLDKMVSEVTCPLATNSISKSLYPSTGGPEAEALKQLNKTVDHEPQVQYNATSSRNNLEDMELETRALTEPLPTNQLGYKNHNLYAIEKWLTKNQILHPKGPILGYCSGNPVYPRSCVQTLQTRHKWLREGLQVRDNEVPAKTVKRSKKPINFGAEPGCSEEESEGTVELYGKWQLEPLKLPHAVNGIVPKNERGQVDVWSEKCLPPGTVHLRLPRLVPVARRLEIDFALAMVGFEFRNGRSFPVFEGIVVCSEFEDAIIEAYTEEEERRESEERKLNELQALSRWFQLLSSIVTRQRLENSYAEPPSISGAYNPSRSQKNSNSNSVARKPESEGDMLGSGLQEEESVQDKGSGRSSSYDHEHVFPVEDQSFDEESCIRTKRCPCGFSIQVEEL